MTAADDGSDNLLPPPAGAERLPPVAFYGKDKSEEFLALCETLACDNDFPLGSRVLKLLRGGGQFDRVNYDDENLDYAIHLAISEFPAGDEDGFKAVAGANREVRAEFVVTWKNVQIGQYVINTHFYRQASLFDTDSEGEERATRDLAAQFVEAVRGDQVFSGEYLYRALAASDYKNQLAYPTQVGDFVYVDQHIFNHPLEGIQLNYAHNIFEFDRYDVFIYPIRRVEWSDANKILSEELSLIAEEIEAAGKDGLYDTLEIVDTGSTRVNSAGRTLNGKGLSLKASANGKTFNSYVYLFAQQDKFIKFRVSYQTSEQMVSEPNAVAFVEAVLPHLKVPEESLFMTRLRHSHKNASL